MHARRACAMPGSSRSRSITSTRTPAPRSSTTRMKRLCIQAVFGDHADRLAVSGTKAYTAHPLGATGRHRGGDLRAGHGAGARSADAELAASRIPPARWMWCRITGRPARIRYAMSNAFGFGGINSCVVLGRVQGDFRISPDDPVQFFDFRLDESRGPGAGQSGGRRGLTRNGKSAFNPWFSELHWGEIMRSDGAVSPQGHARPLRIFVVENHKDTLVWLTRYLEMMGHTVLSARTKREALEALPGAGCEVLISDIGLPDGDGWELLRALVFHARCMRIAMSGFGMTADRAKSAAAGYRHHHSQAIRSQHAGCHP